MIRYKRLPPIPAQPKGVSCRRRCCFFWLALGHFDLRTADDDTMLGCHGLGAARLRRLKPMTAERTEDIECCSMQ
jgi:hypothetical protein